MGSLYKLGRIRSYILIILILLAMVISLPLRNAIQKNVDTKLSSLSSYIFEKTGFKITYESLSPSILSNIYIRDITIYDKDDNKVLEVSKANIGFKLFRLVKKDIQNGISSIVVDGIKIDVDELTYLFEGLDFSKFLEGEGDGEDSSIQKILPGNIKLKNLDFSYDKEPVNFILNVKSVIINNNARKKILELQFDSNLAAKIKSYKNEITSKVEFDGTLTPNLNNSQLNVKISNLTDGNARLNKLNLHVGYNDSVFDIHTVQAVNPLSVAATFNLLTGDLSAQIKSSNLSPVSVVTVNSHQKELKKFKNMTVDTDTILACNLNEKFLNFNSNTRAHVPAEVFPEGFDLVFDISGDQTSCDLHQFEISGKRISASADLSLVYATKQLSGFIGLPYFVMANDKAISTEIYIDSLDQGFMAFSPQLFIGDKALTALQFTLLPQSDSYDFTFESYDYAHTDSYEPGQLSFTGSYLTKSNYLQANISVNSIYCDSLAAFAAQFLNTDISSTIQKFSDKLAPYMLSGDIYASTDLTSVSYNVPYILAANTQADNQVLMISLNGSEQNIQIDQFSLVYGKYACQASGTFDKALDSSDMFFTLDLNSGSIPYRFSGSIMPEVVTVTGDYGTDFEFRFNQNKNFDGHFILKSLPVALGKNSIIFTTDSSFHYDSENGPQVQISNFEAELADSSLSVSPKLVFSGNMTKYGAQINSLAYSDLYSALNGTADLMLNINEGLFDSVGLMLNVKNPLSEESIILDGNISNPYHLPFTRENIMKSIFINMQLQLTSFGLNRFGLMQNDANRLSATLYTSGTIEHPYVSLNVQDSSVLISSEFLNITGSMVLEDRDLDINDLNIHYDFVNVNNIQAKASLETMSMEATGDLNCDLMGKSLEAPLTLSLSNAIVPQGKFLPDSFMVSLSTPKMAGSLLKKQFPLSFNLLYSDKQFALFSSENAGVTGSLSLDGNMDINIDNKDFLQAKLAGFGNMTFADMNLSDCKVDLQKLCTYVNIDDLAIINSGLLQGGVHIGGSLDDPDFSGSMNISKVDLKLPVITKQKMTSDLVTLNFDGNEIDLAKNIFTTKSGARAELELKFFLNKWAMNHLEGSLKTVKKDLFPVFVSNDLFKFEGDLSTDLQLYYEGNIVEVTGKVFGDKVSITSSISSFANSKNSQLSDKNDKNSDKDNDEDSLLIKTDLEVTLGTHVSLTFDPLLRCVFVPNTVINVKVDQEENSYIVDGLLGLKSGDLSYLNRNFYIKSGSIKFNPDDISNPLVTITAETREKDERNQTVKIILTMENQYLQNANPRFTSVPAKSENEIRSLLGQIVVADSENAANFIVAASDYALQSTVVRTAENKLRDLLNFDIFSLRTNFLQNTLNLSSSGKSSRDTITIGNLLDNSTVYIGKYLNSSLYVDALLHISAVDGSANSISLNSLDFQPEFGLELESPIANIRASMTPNINDLLKGQFVPSASLELSWKIAF